MKDIAALSWTTIVAIYGMAIVILLIDGATSDGPLLTGTALVSLPIVALIVFPAFAVVRRRYGR